MQSPGNADSANNRSQTVNSAEKYTNKSHVRNESDEENEYKDSLSEEDESKNSDSSSNHVLDTIDHNRINTLVLEMLEPYKNTGRTVTMDNYYGSAEILIYLLQNGMYGRCTFRKNRKFCPESVLYSRKDARRANRGECKFATSVEHNMSAWGWIDGNPVSMLSTADGTNITTVYRQVGKVKRKVTAPEAIKNYNLYYGGVDRFDLLLSKYSITKRHRFNCYYKSLMMTMIDFGITQAYLTYKLALPRQNKKDVNDEQSRIKFMDSLVDDLLNKNWDEEQYYYNNSNRRRLRSKTMNSTKQEEYNTLLELGVRLENDNDQFEDCTYTSSEIFSSAIRYAKKQRLSQIYQSACANPVQAKVVVTGKKSATCQICEFEGRGVKLENVDYCHEHKIRACSKIFEIDTKSTRFKYRRQWIPISNWDWCCPPEITQKGWSCWQKFHLFYLQAGLFSPNGKMSTKCILYKRRQEALGVRARKGKPPGATNLNKRDSANEVPTLTGRVTLTEMFNEYLSQDIQNVEFSESEQGSVEEI